MKVLCRHSHFGSMKTITSLTKSSFFSLVLSTCTLFSACTDETESFQMGTQLKLNVATAQIESRGIIESPTLPDGHSIGISLTDGGGAKYDGVTYHNIQAQASMGQIPQTWTLKSNVLLSSTDGTIHAYYPYSESVTDMTQIAVSAGETDWMYAEPVSGINKGKPNASIIMRHALAAIRLNIVRGTYTGTGHVTHITVKGDNISHSGTLNAQTGELSNHASAGKALKQTVDFTASTTTTVKDFIFVPIASSAAPTFTITIDGISYIASAPASSVAQGNIYCYTLTVNDTSLQISDSSVVPWDVSTYFSAIIHSSYFSATYNVQSSTTPTQLLSQMFDITQVHRMYIDDVEISPALTYTFVSTGEHTVKCTFKKNALINCRGMFYNCTNLKEIDLSNLDMSNNTSINGMFKDCANLTRIVAPSLNMPKVTTMSAAFDGCVNLSELNVSGWEIPNVTLMTGAFQNCKKLAAVDVSNWKTANVTNMSYLFNNCNTLKTVDVSNWDTSKVTDMTCMFQYCYDLTSLDVSNWNTENVTNMAWLFFQCKQLESLNVKNWDTAKVTDMKGMFCNCIKLPSLELGDWDVSNVKDMKGMFCANTGFNMIINQLDVNNWDTSKVTDMSLMFQNCTNLTSLDVSSWNTTNVTYMNSMFWHCDILQSLDVSKWNTSNVTNMKNMFSHCANLKTLNVSDWNTSKVTDMSFMFYTADGLKSMELESLDVSNWDTSNVTNMTCMFQHCTSLKNLNVSNCITSKVTDMSYMYFDCADISELDVSKWDFSKVTTTYAMLYNVSKLSYFEMNSSINSLTNCEHMFANIYTSGIFKYNSGFDYSKIIAVLPDTWSTLTQ